MKRRQHVWEGVPVPYIAAWSAEKYTTPRVVLRTTRNGVLHIGYPEEMPYDRDGSGILWARQGLGQGRGRPKFETVHVPRQRRAMRDLLCQICGTSTLDSEAAQLWLLTDHSGRIGAIREGEVTTSPPVCVPCARLALRHCPALRKGAAAAWVRHAPTYGVSGLVYDPTTLRPIRSSELTIVPYKDPCISWTLAFRLAVELHECTPVDLDILRAAEPAHP